MSACTPPRPALPADVPAIAALFARARAQAMPWLPVLHTPAEDLAFFRRALDEQQVWVAEQHGRVVGFVATGNGWLHHLYVDPPSQGQGVGDLLLQQARRQHPEGLRFHVFQANRRARQFYERRGARLLALGDGSENEERTPDAVYEWRPR